MRITIRRLAFMALIMAVLWRVEGNHKTAHQADRAWRSGDYQTAVAIWRTLVDEGDLRAQVRLAQAYEWGLGVAQDQVLSWQLYQHAAERGESASQYRLAEAYLRGGHVKRDLNAAYHWFERAAQGGNVMAQLKFGALCLLGIKGQPEWEKGRRYLLRAASAGNETALLVLKELVNRELGEGTFTFDELERLVAGS